MPGRAEEQRPSATTDTAAEPTPAQAKAAKLATWSLVSGIVSLPVPGVEIAAVALGVTSLSVADDDVDDEATRRKALAGIALGVVALLMHLLAALVAVLLMLFLPQSRQQAQASVPPAPVPTQTSIEGPLATAPPSGQTATPPPKRSGQIWYYDLNNGRLFTGKATDIAPIDAPSGPLPGGAPAGVKAYVFSYGDCDDESQRFVAWLERASRNAKRVAEEGKTNSTGAGGNLSVDDWVDVLTAPLEVSEDAVSWRPIHPVSYVRWQLQKRQSLVQNGVHAKPCQP